MRVLYRAWPVLIPLIPILLMTGWWWNVRLTPMERQLVGIWTFNVPDDQNPVAPWTPVFVELHPDRSVQVVFESEGQLQYNESSSRFSWRIKKGHLQVWDSGPDTPVLERILNPTGPHWPSISLESPLNTIQSDTVNLHYGNLGDIDWHRLDELPDEVQPVIARESASPVRRSD